MTSPSLSIPGQLVTGFDIDRTSFFVDDVLGDELANDVFERHQQIRDLAFVDQFLDRARRDFFTALAMTSPVCASTRS